MSYDLIDPPNALTYVFEFSTLIISTTLILISLSTFKLLHRATMMFSNIYRNLAVLILFIGIGSFFEGNVLVHSNSLGILIFRFATLMASLSLLYILRKSIPKIILTTQIAKIENSHTLELKESKAFLDSLIDNLPNMVFVKDAKNLKFVRLNRAGAELIGFTAEELLGKNDYHFFPPEQAQFFVEKDRKVLNEKQIVDIPDEPISTRNKGVRILHTKKIPLFDHDGNPEFLLGISEDITDRVKAEKEQLRISREQAALEERERANRQSAFLAEASTLLASSLNYLENLNMLAHVAVPVLADWCTIIITKKPNEYEQVAGVHRDSQKTKLIGELLENYPPQASQETLANYNSFSDKPVIIEKIDEHHLRKIAQNERHLEIMRELGSSSCILVPIPGREKNHGTIAFVYGDSKRIFTQEDLFVTEELGRRAGIAIDNAILYETANNAIQARDEFLSVASHELKTPITSLKLQLQVTRRAIQADKGIVTHPMKLVKALEASNLQINRLTRLVDNLLDVSRIRAGSLCLDFEETHLPSLINDVADRFSEQLREAQSQIIIEVVDPIVGFWDRTRIEQVLINLISNAIKYAPGRPIQIKAHQKDEIAKIEVKDHGPGIPTDKQKIIFERFERANASKNISGLGLGLFIVNQIIKAHQGTITVESKPDEGATFIVEIPIHPRKVSANNLAGMQEIGV